MKRTSVKQRIKIAEPWITGIYIPEDGILLCNLINIDTGEIRQVRYDFDTVARRLFGSRINKYVKSNNDVFKTETIV